MKYTLIGFFLFLTVFIQAVIPGAQDMADDGEGASGRQGEVNFPQGWEGPGVQSHIPCRIPQEQELIGYALQFLQQQAHQQDQTLYVEEEMTCKQLIEQLIQSLNSLDQIFRQSCDLVSYDLVLAADRYSQAPTAENYRLFVEASSNVDQILKAYKTTKNQIWQQYLNDFFRVAKQA